jgi:DNA polymerase III epsilon subunit-like protein
MKNLQMFVKIILLLMILCSFSCSLNKQREPVEVNINQQENKVKIEATQDNKKDNIESVKETEIEIIEGKNGELTTEGLTQNRDMALYDKAGQFDCRGFYPKDKPKGECNENKIRDFIWQHWTNKKLGYIGITYNTVDSISTFHMFIEPNDKGKWNSVWRIARNQAMSKPQMTDISGISVEKVRDKPKTDNWALVFKSNSGRVVKKIPDYYE